MMRATRRAGRTGPPKKQKATPTSFLRVSLPDEKSKRGAAATREDEISQLRDIADEAFSTRDRFRERAFLASVYDLYRVWVDDGRATARTQKMLELFTPKVRRTAHPITVILGATLTRLDQKIRSKWSQALQYAHKQNVSPEDLSSFMDENGGMAACASAFADLKRYKQSRRKAAGKSKKVTVRKRRAR